MGQYHTIVNFDKREKVSPHAIGLGLKQIEHTHTVASLSDVLYMLMSTSPNRGGGDLDVDGKLEQAFRTWGRWVGDRVAVFGDYTEPADVPFLKMKPDKDPTEHYKNIGNAIIPALELAFQVKVKPGPGWRDRELEWWSRIPAVEQEAAATDCWSLA